jgi:hypothetical protein
LQLPREYAECRYWLLFRYLIAVVEPLSSSLMPLYQKRSQFVWRIVKTLKEDETRSLFRFMHFAWINFRSFNEIEDHPL